MKVQTTREVIELLSKAFATETKEDFRERVLAELPTLSSNSIVALGIVDTDALNRAVSSIFWWEF